MILNILPNHFSRDFVPHRTDKIPVLPQFATPKLPLHLLMTAKYLPRTDTLEKPYYPRYRVPRGKRNKQMDVIFRYLHSLNHNLMVQTYPPHKTFNSRSKIT